MQNEKIEQIGKIATEGFNDVSAYRKLIENLSDEYEITEIRAGLVVNICYAYMVNDDSKIKDYLKKKLNRLLNVE